MTKVAWQSKKTVWIAAGGTAGHLLPALGVAEALIRGGLARSEIGFIGSTRPLESQLVTPYGFELVQLDLRGFVRKLSSTNILGLWLLLKATWRLVIAARKTHPKVLIGFGGYFSFPPVIAAKITGIPCVIVETNAVAGLANRLASKIATEVLVSSETSGLKGAKKVGVPLRPEISSWRASRQQKDSFRRAQNIDESAFLVCVFGGSLGSFTVNTAVLDLVEWWQARDDLDIVVYHVIGSRDFPKFEDRARQRSGVVSKVKYIYSEFDSQIYKALSECDLVVSRAGSGTVAELGYFGKAAVLVPLPNAPGDHQNKNAQMLANLGAARVIFDDELSKERLGSVVEALYRDRSVLDEMSKRSAESFKGDGAPQIGELVLGLMAKEGGE
ncbi:MAG: UDP-N-acetylglucosamine--N-acetylmuramyl-(pentapeptide) pyrophosphoryl-undecaprenol N-acetylglucosamine transferase [Actinomycetota bacterium]|nr:MAG: UDP-N-acetylglucosamine--N-acetylmuramyl-(pentapeptide) pyrophosphoryl-undecaprenol N-acetylglucosamine transferase [Actinomycetota bacterium]